MKHVFEIKDYVATEQSAKHIMHNQINVILSAKRDIEIAGINVYVNSVDTQFYQDFIGDIPVKFIPTLNCKKKNKQVNKQSFASFHNAVINSSILNMTNNNAFVHIMDGTLDLTDAAAERDRYKTRLGEMINDVMQLMNLLDHPVWFNTASDKGNLKFGHYYTKLDLLNIDEECHFESMPECIMYAGNSNLDWIMINTAEYKQKKMPSLMMNNEYDYDFLSIKQLIAKFANWENGYFDSMFPTIPTEVGAYFRNKNFDKDLIQYNVGKYKENIKKYQNNLQEYSNLRPISIKDVVEFVKTVLENKLTKSDKEKLQIVTNTTIA